MYDEWHTKRQIYKNVLDASVSRYRWPLKTQSAEELFVTLVIVKFLQLIPWTAFGLQ